MFVWTKSEKSNKGQGKGWKRSSHFKHCPYAFCVCVYACAFSSLVLLTSKISTIMNRSPIVHAYKSDTPMIIFDFYMNRWLLVFSGANPYAHVRTWTLWARWGCGVAQRKVEKPIMDKLGLQWLSQHAL